MNEYDKGYAAGLRHAFLIAKSIAKTQAFYLDTVIGTRQAWVRSQIAERIQDAADLFAVSDPVEPKPAPASVASEEPSSRAQQKQRSRDADAQALASGEKTREQLRRENGAFAFPRERVTVHFSRAEAIVERADDVEAQDFAGACVQRSQPAPASAASERCERCHAPPHKNVAGHACEPCSICVPDAPIPTDEALAAMTVERDGLQARIDFLCEHLETRDLQYSVADSSAKRYRARCADLEARANAAEADAQRMREALETIGMGPFGDGIGFYNHEDERVIVARALASPPQAATGGSEAVRNAVEAWRALDRDDADLVVDQTRWGISATAADLLAAFAPMEPTK